MSTIKLLIDINRKAFVRKLSGQLATNHNCLYSLVREILMDEIESSLRASLPSEDVLEIKLHQNHPNACCSIKEAIELNGYTIWYFGIEIDLRPGTVIAESS